MCPKVLLACQPASPCQHRHDPPETVPAEDDTRTADSRWTTLVYLDGDNYLESLFQGLAQTVPPPVARVSATPRWQFDGPFATRWAPAHTEPPFPHREVGAGGQR